MPRPRLPKTMWDNDNIRVEAKSSGVVDEPENVRVFEACLSEMGAARLRVMVGCYGPGTEARGKPKYHWILGESATILCRDVDTVTWFRTELLNWLKSLDRIKLEVVSEDGDQQ